MILKYECPAVAVDMYGWARIPTRGASAGARVPLSSVQRASGVEVVFVRLTEALYETRRVETAARGDGWVEVTRGVVPGDITAAELAAGRLSGLRQVLQVLRGGRGVAVSHFDAHDVVRHPLVQRIVQAYEAQSDGPDRER